MTNFERELEAIQIFVKQATDVNSFKLAVAPPKLSRPVILWEAPSRGLARRIDQYTEVRTVRQFGKLYVSSLNEANKYQDQFYAALQLAGNVIEIKEGGQRIGILKAVQLEFRESETLDIPFSLRYEVAYEQGRPALAPKATTVVNKITTDF